MKKKAIIYVPGLNDHVLINKNLTKLLPWIWQNYGYSMFIIQPQWNKGSFSSKLTMILNKIDQLHSQDYEIYLFGQSAGGAAVLNAFVARKNKIKRVINICGRINKGKHVSPSLEKAAKGNLAFKESVLLFENENAKKLTLKDKKIILIIKPICDGIVPALTTNLDNVKTITLPVLGHSIGGIAALTIFSKRIKNFLS